VRVRRRGGHLGVYLRAAAHLVRLRPDVVVDVQNGLPFFSRLVARRVVVLVHHVHREQWPVVFGPRLARVGWWIESRVAPRLYRGCPYVTVSAHTREELAGLGVRVGDIRVVHNATEPPLAVAAARSATPTLCVVSRLVPHKRVDHAVEVLHRLRDRWPGLRLVVVGHGWAAGDLAARVAALGLADRVDLLGFTDERTKHEVLASSWLHLCPSLKEGWGRAVMEAATHGVPTVAYASAGGVTEAVRDGRTGLLVDDLDGLTAAVDRLLADGAERERLGAAAERHAAGFTWAAAVAAFAELVETRGRRRSAVAVVVERLLHRRRAGGALLDGLLDAERGTDTERDPDDGRDDDGHEGRHALAPPSGRIGTLPAGNDERGRRHTMIPEPVSRSSAAASARTTGTGSGPAGSVTGPGSR
jgi:glycosyltransferase involved in cell wall biosynthesis